MGNIHPNNDEHPVYRRRKVHELNRTRVLPEIEQRYLKHFYNLRDSLFNKTQKRRQNPITPKHFYELLDGVSKDDRHKFSERACKLFNYPLILEPHFTYELTEWIREVETLKNRLKPFIKRYMSPKWVSVLERDGALRWSGDPDRPYEWLWSMNHLLGLKKYLNYSWEQFAALFYYKDCTVMVFT